MSTRHDHDERDDFTGGVLVTALALLFGVCAVLFFWVLYANASDETIAWAHDMFRDGLALLVCGFLVVAIRRAIRRKR